MQFFIALDDIICSKKRSRWEVALFFIVLDDVICSKKWSMWEVAFPHSSKLS